MSSPRKVHVPQEDGEITVTPGGVIEDARTYVITDHLASPRTNAEQQQLLALVDGAHLARAEKAPKTGQPPAVTPNPDVPAKPAAVTE